MCEEQRTPLLNLSFIMVLYMVLMYQKGVLIPFYFESHENDVTVIVIKRYGLQPPKK